MRVYELGNAEIYHTTFVGRFPSGPAAYEGNRWLDSNFICSPAAGWYLQIPSGGNCYDAY